jgi:hypothetical protein
MTDYSSIDPTVVTLVLGDHIVPLPQVSVAPGEDLPGLTAILLGLLQENRVLAEGFTCTGCVMKCNSSPG